jgi:hypothetical protein
MAEAKTPREKAAEPARPEERRSGNRLRSRLLADGNLRDPQGAVTSFLGSTIDLSLAGTRVRTYEALEPGMRVALILRLPENDVAATGAVVHVTVDAIGCSLAGIRFDPLVAESAKLLSAHLHAFLSRTRRGAIDEAGPANPVATEVPVTGRVESRREQG